MRVLLDTHAFLWAVAEPERLGQQRDLVADPATELLLSAASSWEIAIKHALGRLLLPGAPKDYVPSSMRRLATIGLAVEHAHVLAGAELPLHHRDPFDRLLIAQSHQLDVPILSADRLMRLYDVDLLEP